MSDERETFETTGNLAAFSDQIQDAVDSPDSGGSDFSPVPAGSYHLECVSAELKTSKAGKQYVDAQFSVCGGKFSNRRIFEIFSLEGSSKSVGISMRQLAKLAELNGKNLADSSDIVGAHCVAKVRVEEGQPRADGEGKYPDRNRCSYFEEYVGQSVEEEAAKGDSDWDASNF